MATYNPDAWLTLGILSFVVNLAVFAYTVSVIVKRKRNPLKQEMFVELKAYRRNLEANNLLPDNALSE